MAEGTGVELGASHNSERARHARQLVETFLHARYFVKVMVIRATEGAIPSTLRVS